MAHDKNTNEKVVFVGDSRVRKRIKPALTPPPDYSAYPGKSEAFIPNFLLKEWMVGVVVLVGFLVLTIAEPAPLGYPADPTNAGFIPMPDWYFLFLYQFLKLPYVSGHYVVLGTIGVPGIAFGALLLAPFLDTGKERRFYRRPIASLLMFMALISVVYLTKQSWDHYQEELKLTNTIPEDIAREEKAREAAMQGIDPAEAAAQEANIPLVDEKDPAMDLIVEKAQCVACHGTDLKGNANAGIPSFHGIGDKFKKEEFVDIVTNGAGGGAMPAFKDRLSAEEIDQIATWLAKQKKPAE